MHDIQDYVTADGKDPFKDWVASLADRMARARLLARVQRMAAGNFGDCKPLDDGVWELRIDHGAGYRIYYARAGSRLILLLTGGDKRRQKADIATAVDYWQDLQRRNK
ncbi:type II toxin-antitoxin system RelE/ParE family toxin [Propionivibrio sp.]|uniref:type II toxin-antitoxin system RelE/ParE family toxin n=1 Tax=Propionivibrio sp. TaxID=2212460 RepID=UPI003BF27D53